MGFLDKAKEMAEQAQRKIEEAQKQFNEKQARDAGTSPSASDAAATPPPAAEGTPPPAADPAESPAPGEQAGTNRSPDPFKPIG